MAKKQQHFKTTYLIGGVRSALTELTASGVTKRVTASLVQKPLFGGRMLYRVEIIRGAPVGHALKFASAELIFLMESAWEESIIYSVGASSAGSLGLPIFCWSSTEKSKNWLKV